jgi:molybdopterin-guanine dinucleotide biosynthesis protein B
MEQNMIPIVSIVGRSNSGKTTLIEKLIPELRRLGYRIATIKHNVHGFDIDHEGKDSWRHKKAGAQVTVIASPGRVAVIEDTERDYEIAELRDRYIRDVDLILLEGFKGNPYPKIEVFRPELHSERLCRKEDNLLAVVTEKPAEEDVPCFRKEDISDIASLIEDLFLKNA